MYSITHAEILEQIRFILADHLCLPTDDVSASATLDEELGIDSLDLAEISIALEDAFNVTIDADDVCKFRMVSDIAAFVGERAMVSA
jgi:acyl carrier protein